MLIPVGPQFGAQNLVLVTKQDGKVRTKTLMPVRFVPFTRAKQKTGASLPPPVGAGATDVERNS